ncbi:hypothetical protein Z043_108072, partial [Scleropages formosus]
NTELNTHDVSPPVCYAPAWLVRGRLTKSVSAAGSESVCIPSSRRLTETRIVETRDRVSNTVSRCSAQSVLLVECTAACFVTQLTSYAMEVGEREAARQCYIDLIAARLRIGEYCLLAQKWKKKFNRDMLKIEDGLVFAFENGKPKIVLSHHSFDEAVPEKPQRGTSSRRKTVPDASAIRKENKAPSRFTFKDTSTENRASPLAKFPARARPSRKSEKDQRVPSQKQSKVATESSKESMVCLTREQLQMILNTISQASGNSSVNPSCSSQPLSGGSQDELNEETTVSGTEKSHPGAVGESAHHNKNDNSAAESKDDRVISHGLSRDLFS